MVKSGAQKQTANEMWKKLWLKWESLATFSPNMQRQQLVSRFQNLLFYEKNVFSLEISYRDFQEI